MITELENGNLVLRRERDYRCDSSPFIELLYEVDEKDTYVIDEDWKMFCNLGPAYVNLYNIRRDKIYILDGPTLNGYEEYEEITLYANDPDETDRELIEEWEERESA